MYASDATHHKKSLEEKLQSIYGLRSADAAPIELGLRPDYIKLLARLDNPQDKMPPTIHLAGTNGKGSVIAILLSLLNAHGYTSHTYTSPHLVSFNERIKIAGSDISDELLENYLDDVLEIAKDLSVTFFELTTALAFKVFADHADQADFVLLETGLGGRLDCTNAIQEPLATIITKIGFDHTEFLGDTLFKIAGEKAGIMKDGSMCFIGKQSDASLYDFFSEYAAKTSCPIRLFSKDWQFNEHHFSSNGKSYDLSSLSLHGEHQYENAASALSCLIYLEEMDHVKELEADLVIKGLKDTSWPARLQHLKSGKLVQDLDERTELWIDGGHNEMAGNMLAQQAKIWRTSEPRSELHLICAMMNHKDPLTFLKNIIQNVGSITFIPITGEEQSFSASDISRIIQKNYKDVHVQTSKNLYSAIDTINSKYIKQTKAPQAQRILVCGSLYLAGEVLATNNG